MRKRFPSFVKFEQLIDWFVFQVAQQLSGINAVNFYSTTIFRQAELSEQSSRIATVGTGASQLLMIMPTVCTFEEPPCFCNVHCLDMPLVSDIINLVTFNLALIVVY